MDELTPDQAEAVLLAVLDNPEHADEIAHALETDPGSLFADGEDDVIDLTPADQPQQ